MTKKKKDKPTFKTMICMILDRSGSMTGRETDVVGGVNTFLKEQREAGYPGCITLVRFDSVSIERFRPMTEISKIKDMTRDEYTPRGSTPLLDAVGASIVALDEDWKTEKPDRCIVVIITDGLENSSTEWTKEKVKTLIEAKQTTKQWSFLYLGANIDSFAEASKLGIHQANTANYENTTKGTVAMYKTVSHAVRGMGVSGQCIAPNLGKDIGEEP